MGNNTKYYWYTAHNGTRSFDWMYIRVDDYYGFDKEPSYEIVEKMDLRDEFYGTFSELKARKRL